MLEDRADAQLQALARRGNLDGRAGDQDLALVGLQHAREDADQRGFAGAVLAQQHMDFTGAEVERDLVVGEDAGEALGDIANRGDGSGALAAPIASRRCRGTCVTHHLTLHRRAPPLEERRGRMHGIAVFQPAYCGASVTEVMRARTAAASHTGSTFRLPPTIWSRTADTWVHTSSGMCLVCSSC